MLITEYRIPMPVTVQEYEIGQRYAISKAQLEETGGGEGVEVVKNEPYKTTGRYTKKIYHLKNKVPLFIKAIMPAGAMKCVEESWNCYPYCETVFTNPGYMKEHMVLKVQSLHLADRVARDNAHRLSHDLLDQRKVVTLDIGDINIVPVAERKSEYNPNTFHSEETGRGPIFPKWYNNYPANQPMMWCYKLVTVHFQWTGVGSIVRSKIMGMYPKVFTKVNMEVFCQIDEWNDFDKDELVTFEIETKAKLDQQRISGGFRGIQGAG